MNLGQVHLPLLGAHKQIKLHNCHSDTEGLVQFHESSLAISPESVSAHNLESAVSVGFSVMILTPLDHIISLLSLQLGSWISTQYLAVNLCICFHQLFDEGFMVTIRVVASLIIEGQFRHPFHYC